MTASSKQPGALPEGEVWHRLLVPGRTIGLTVDGTGDARFEQVLTGRPGGELFPGSRSPEGALAGLWLYGGFWSRAHQVAQELETAEGSYWHGILHRIEQDYGNALYWFRRLGGHPTDAELVVAVNRLRAEMPIGDWPDAVTHWDPAVWVRFVAAVRPGSAEERFAVAVQQEEWRLLFAYCAYPASRP